ADISKGALFYHFKNKRDLYCYLYEYSCKKIYEKIDEQQAMEETDFFKQNIKAIEAKVCTMIEYPCIYDFSLRAYYETDKAVEEDIKSINQRMLRDTYIHFNNNIDTGKFRNIEDVNKAVKILVWLSEGFLKERKIEGRLNLKELQMDFTEYVEILKWGFYN
ncbi:MAG: TetR/AcrR family transcriptional regulator, partial [Ruminiclostridium sp.]